MGGSPVGERTFVTISLAIIVRPPFKGHDRDLLVEALWSKEAWREGGEGVKVVAGAEL